MYTPIMSNGLPCSLVHVLDVTEHMFHPFVDGESRGSSCDRSEGY